METQYNYRTEAEWTLHQRGMVSAENVPGAMEFSTPPEFGGEGGVWTPEHFLLAAVGSCFVATFRAIARASKLEFHGIRITVDGRIEKKADGLRFTKIFLRPEATVVREEDRERANRLLEKAERGCLIARSLEAEFVMEPVVTVESTVPSLT